MSTHFGRKIRIIRESIKMGRAEFCEATGLKKGTLIGIETNRQEPSAKALEDIVQKWPEFTLWLMTGKTIPEAGQVSPEAEERRISLKQG